MPNSPSPSTHAGRLAGLVAALALSQAACGTAPSTPEAVDSGSISIPMLKPSVTVAPPPPLVTPVTAPPSQPPVVLSGEASPAPDVVTALLSYADRLHALSWRWH